MEGFGHHRLLGGARAALALAVCVLLAAGCGKREEAPSDEAARDTAQDAGRAAPPEPAAGAADTAAGSPETPTHTEMRNVDLRIAEGVILHVRRLTGEAVSSRPGRLVTLDDKTSYVIRVQSAEAFIGYDDLARVMNDYTFNFEGAPIKDLKIKREEDAGEEDEIELTGQLRRVLGVPIEIEGRPEATPDGRIRIRTTSIQALDVKVGGLMDALGIEPEDMLGDLEQRGLQVDGNDLILDASRALPPPRVEGRVTGVRVEAGGLDLSFGAPEARPAQAADSSNDVRFRHGTIRLGKMTQRDADLRIVDADPKDPLDFYSDKMTRQLVAGYARLGAEGGLTIFVPDYGDIR